MDFHQQWLKVHHNLSKAAYELFNLLKDEKDRNTKSLF